MGTPSTFTMVASECLTERSAPGSGAIAGWVSDSSSGMGMPGAQVTLSWDVRGTDAPGRQQLQAHSDGWYLACDVPADIPISVDARLFDRQARLREVSVPDGGSTEAGIVFDELESMLVFLNGARASNTDMLFELPPDAIDRIVIYKPVEAGNLFGLGAGNGVIVIYTKGN